MPLLRCEICCDKVSWSICAILKFKLISQFIVNICLQWPQNHRPLIDTIDRSFIDAPQCHLCDHSNEEFHSWVESSCTFQYACGTNLNKRALQRLIPLSNQWHFHKLVCNDLYLHMRKLYSRELAYTKDAVRESSWTFINFVHDILDIFSHLPLWSLPLLDHIQWCGLLG